MLKFFFNTQYDNRLVVALKYFLVFILAIAITGAINFSKLGPVIFMSIIYFPSGLYISADAIDEHGIITVLYIVIITLGVTTKWNWVLLLFSLLLLINISGCVNQVYN